MFLRETVVLQPGERGGDITVGEWLHGYWWADPANPLYRICTTCPKLIWEFGMQRHREISARALLNREQPETLVDKHNDAFDSCKLFLKKFPPARR